MPIFRVFGTAVVDVAAVLDAGVDAVVDAGVDAGGGGAVELGTGLVVFEVQEAIEPRKSAETITAPPAFKKSRLDNFFCPEFSSSFLIRETIFYSLLYLYAVIGFIIYSGVIVIDPVGQ
jgi:hypothetical protein